MNRIPIRAGALVALLVAAAQTPAAAQVTFDLQVSPMVTGTFFLSDPPSRFAIHRQAASPLIVEDGEFGRTVGVGVNGGVRIADDIGLEGMFWWVPTELSARGGLASYGNKVNVNTLMYGVTASYYFPTFASFEPFVGIGVGAETMMYDPQLAWERHTHFMSNAVVGVQYWLNDRLAVRAEGRDCLTRFHSDVQGIDDTYEHDLMISAGFTFRSRLR